MSVVGIKIEGNDDILYYNSNNIELSKDITVIVEKDKILYFGKVVLIDDKLDCNNFPNIVRKSTKKDYLKHLNNLKDAKKTVVKCRELVKKANLKMNIVDASYNFDRKILLFRFLADERIDFRQLAKDLGSLYKTRIELRQIGTRDKAKEVGGIGPCGRTMCCCSFLKEFESVSINMAKNQNLALNPSKINGACGRLMCCLQYENSTYNDLKKEMPELGKRIKNKEYEGRVVAVDIFEQKYKILTDDNEIIEIKIDKDGSKE